MKNFFQIFKAGSHIDNNGYSVHINESDVHQIAQVYDPELHEAPIVIGHPQTDDPAFGWVKELNATNGVLSADFSQMDDDFVNLVKQGRYKKISASFYPPDSPSNPKPGSWYLRHVGFLGAQPPAVKGLSAVNFADDDVFMEFSETPEYTSTDSENQSIFNDDNKEDSMSLEQQLVAEKMAREAAEQAAADAKEELKRFRDEQERDLREAAHQKNVDFAEDLVKQGRLKPVDKNLMIQILDFAEYPQHCSVDFGEGEQKKTLSEALRGFFSQLPEVLKQGHYAAGSQLNSSGLNGLPADFAEASDPKALSHHERALALQAKENISYQEAARRTAQ